MLQAKNLACFHASGDESSMLPTKLISSLIVFSSNAVFGCGGLSA